MRELVKAATPWPTNAHLIKACAQLGYLKEEWRTLDPTYGQGRWWVLWRPDDLVTHNRKVDGSDFRCLPYPDGAFDAIAYDPPYVSVGGRKTSGIEGMYDGYGLIDAPDSPAGLQVLINDGLTEMYRLVRPKGYVLVKCQDYVSSGKLWIGTHHTLTHGLSLGFTLEDRLEHISGQRPQPANRRQVHARRNLSTLFVFRKGRK